MNLHVIAGKNVPALSNYLETPCRGAGGELRGRMSEEKPQLPVSWSLTGGAG